MAMCNCFVSLLLLSTVSCVVSGTNRTYFDAKTRLVKYLTNNSKLMKEILPAQDINTPVDVNVKIYLRQITNVDERYQAIRSTVWLRLNWNNPFLSWDPVVYGGIKNVHANHELFWVPDVALLNEATLEEQTDVLYTRLNTKLIIDKNGDCWWNVPATLLSQCKIDVSHFPFDDQECHISIGSWAYSSHKINFTYFERNADLTNFIESAEWKLKSAVLNNILRRYNYYGTELPYTDVTLTLKIKRRSLYYFMNIILPPLTIMFLSLVSFCLPSGHGERITFVISLLLAFTVYMLIASSFLPETSAGAPRLVIFYLTFFFAMSLCLCATCYSVKNPNISWSWTWDEFKAKLCCCCKDQSSQNYNHKKMEDERNKSNDEESGAQGGEEPPNGTPMVPLPSPEESRNQPSQTGSPGGEETPLDGQPSQTGSPGGEETPLDGQPSQTGSPGGEETPLDGQPSQTGSPGGEETSHKKCCSFPPKSAKLDTCFLCLFLFIYILLVVIFISVI